MIREIFQNLNQEKGIQEHGLQVRMGVQTDNQQSVIYQKPSIRQFSANMTIKHVILQ